MNELLNRWRHGEVNLLQRRFRLARAQAVNKQTIASKFLGSLAAPSSNSNSGTATSAATSANRDGSACFGEDGSTSPVSRDGTNTTAATATASTELDSKRLGESATGGPTKVGGGAVNNNGSIVEARHVVSLGDAGGARAGMDKEAFLRVFPELQVCTTYGMKERSGHGHEGSIGPVQSSPVPKTAGVLADTSVWYDFACKHW